MNLLPFTLTLCSVCAVKGLYPVRRMTSNKEYFLISLFVDRTAITYKCNTFTVGAPARCINGSLPAIEVGNHFWCPATDRHQPQQYAFVKRMIACINCRWKRNDHHPFAIGRDMRKPVIILIEGELFLSAAIRFHPPDLHSAG